MYLKLFKITVSYLILDREMCSTKLQRFSHKAENVNLKLIVTKIFTLSTAFDHFRP
jgi:hypothetical protein